VHDPIEPKVEVGLVELKQLLEERLQFFVAGAHGVSYAVQAGVTGN
jgi:hypothetical protein